MIHRGETVGVSWIEPAVDFHGRDFAITSSHSNGGQFDLGVTIVTYTVEGLGDASGVMAECSFEVKVFASSGKVQPCAIFVGRPCASFVCC